MERSCHLARLVLLCAGATYATGGIATNSTATWTGAAGDSSWSNWQNWNWSSADCNENHDVPGTVTDATSDCYNPTVNIPDGEGTVNQDDLLAGYIFDFTLGSGDVLNGFLGSTGNVTISGGAVVNGGISASSTTVAGTLPGTLTNKGTINLTGGGASGCTIVNNGTISGWGSIFTPFNTTQCGNTGSTTTATNTNTIEAHGGSLQLGGTWNNAGGTIQIDSGAALQASGTITGGSLINKGGAITGGILTLAGTVSASSLTLDCPGGAGTCGELNIGGTVNHSGVLTVGATGGLTEVIVNSGGTLNAGTTLLGVQSGATGELLVDGGGTANLSGTLTVGDSGGGELLIEGTMSAGTINLGYETSGHGSLNMGGSDGPGTLTYTTLQAPARSGGAPGLPSGIQLDQSSTLTGTGVPGSSGPDDLVGVDVQLDGTWTVGNGMVVSAGEFLIESGALKVSCNQCGAPGFGTGNGGGALQLIGTSTMTLSGSGVMVTSGGLLVGSSTAVLNVGGGATLNAGVLLTNGEVNLNGTGSQVTAETTVAGSGAMVVQNGAALNASLLSVNGNKAQLAVRSSGTVTATNVNVRAGNLTTDAGTALTMTGSPANPPLLAIGAGASPAVLSISGALNDAYTVSVYQSGTLQIEGGASVAIGGIGSLNPRVSLSGGTLDVSQGQMTIGTAASAGQGWVTVGVLGTLSGGVICPAPSSGNPNPPCNPDTLVNGPGHVTGNVSNRGGTVSISDPTTLNVTGDYDQDSGTLELAIDGTQSGEYDQLVVAGSIQITGGTVEFDFGNGFAPGAGNAFELLSGGGGVSVSGATYTYTGLAGGFNYTTNAAGDQFDLTAQNGGTSTTTVMPPPASSGIRQLSSAAGGAAALAPGSLASIYAASGTDLSSGPPTPSAFPWPTQVDGTTVTILDSTEASTAAELIYVSAGQVNFLIPDGVALGPATVTVTSGSQTVATGPITLTALAPALFTLNTSNLAAAYASCVSASGTTTEYPFQVVNGEVSAQPLNLGACSQTILQLLGTGLDGAAASDIQATIGTATATVQTVRPGSGFPGLDEIDLVIPQSLAGSGNVPVVLSAGGMTSNMVNITIQ